MAKNNPARPFDSPISVSHAGDWKDEFRHEISPERSRPATKPVPNRIKHVRGVFPDDDLFEPTDAEVFREDSRINQVLKRDLQNRNIPQPQDT